VLLKIVYLLMCRMLEMAVLILRGILRGDLAKDADLA
jgi:hypothetical protein